MSRVLFVTWDGGGNVPPALGLASELRRRGDEVSFLGHEVLRRRVIGQGFGFTALPASDHDSTRARPEEERGRALIQNVILSPAVAAAAAEAAKAADAAVVDCMMLSAVSALSGRLPTVPLLHSAGDFWREYFTRGRVAQVLAGLGAPPPLETLEACPLLLVASIPELDLDPMPERYRCVGPIFEESPATGETFPDGLVLVSFSSAYQAGQQQALQNAVDALEGLDEPLLVTVGPAHDPAGLSTPANALVRAFVPHAEVMPRARLLIGHGGHSTLMLALAQGVPAVLMPMMEVADQPYLAAAIERLGAGRHLAKTAGPAEIRAAVVEVLGEPSYAAAALGLGAAIRRTRGAAAAADEIGSLLAVSAQSK